VSGLATRTALFVRIPTRQGGGGSTLLFSPRSSTLTRVVSCDGISPTIVRLRSRDVVATGYAQVIADIRRRTGGD
jgi:hypothetical protein